MGPDISALAACFAAVVLLTLYLSNPLKSAVFTNAGRPAVLNRYRAIPPCNSRCVMRTLRFGSAILSTLAILAFLPLVARGQTLAKQLESFRKPANEPGGARGQITEFRDLKVTLTSPTPADKAVFTQMAQFLINRVTHHEFHATSPEPAELKPRPADNTVTKLISDLRAFLLVPAADGTLTLPQEAYIREFGIALNASLTPILVTEKGKAPPPSIIRVNAGRLLEVACGSGATAHWPMVIGLLKNPETPPDVLFYALKAAEGLLGGFDVSRLSRLDPVPEKAEQILYDLVHELEGIVIQGPKILGKIHVEGGSRPTLVTDPKAKPTSLHAEQLVAIQLYRLQAIRALARLRNDILGGKVNTALELRPVYTLARVAIGDPAITPALSKKEIAEAVIGLVRINPGANLNVDELAYAVSFGTRVVFGAKAANAEDATIPWKGYAGRMNAAFQEWQANSAKNTRVVAKQKESINSLVKKSFDGLFNPVINPPSGATTANPVNLQVIDGWQVDNAPGNAQQLFSDVKTFKLVYGGK